MTETCPISSNRIDANFARIIAAQVIIIALLLIYTQELIFSLILLFDFSIRLLKIKRLSFLSYISKFIIQLLQIDAKPCDESPKRFALYLGIVIIATFTLLYFFQFNTLASIFVSILLVCAFLESAFDYCIGCKVYYLLQYLQIKR